MTLSAEGEGTGTMGDAGDPRGTPFEEPDPIGRKRPYPVEEDLSTGRTEGKEIVSPGSLAEDACATRGKGTETTVVSAGGLTGGDGLTGGNGTETTVSTGDFTGSAGQAGRIGRTGGNGTETMVSSDGFLVGAWPAGG